MRDRIVSDAKRREIEARLLDKLADELEVRNRYQRGKSYLHAEGLRYRARLIRGN